LNLPAIVSIQNAYNLLNRTFETGLAEVCHYQQIGLLAYSPLGFGCLSGKYLQSPSGTGRVSLFPGFGQRYLKPNVKEAVADYVALAQKYDLSPVAMALAFVRQQWFVTSTIVGATTLAQLDENLASLNLTLSKELLIEIDRIHSRYPNPAP
jgi:aryl-alcohol dehydrogenase (NADP+)